MSGKPRLTISGTGYLGITHAACMASLGFDVLGVGTDPAKVDKLSVGIMPICKPGLPELLKAELGTGRLPGVCCRSAAAASGSSEMGAAVVRECQGLEGSDRDSVGKPSSGVYASDLVI